jgi:uncharacterized coiled-coil protein SlyX
MQEAERLTKLEALVAKQGEQIQNLVEALNAVARLVQKLTDGLHTHQMVFNGLYQALKEKGVIPPDEIPPPVN